MNTKRILTPVYDPSDKRFTLPHTEFRTPYELVCGGTQQIESEGCTIDSGISLTLWQEPACRVFQVRAHNFGTGQRIFWDSFNTLTAARKRYLTARRELGLGVR
jgi:hypothetical protein